MQSNSSNTAPASGKQSSNFWLWVVIAVIVLVALFWFFKKPTEDKMEKVIPTPTPTPQPLAVDDISGLDVGDNPDVSTDDFSSTLPVSQEAVNP